MRKILRKWLGVDDPMPVRRDNITRDEVRSIVKQAITESLDSYSIAENVTVARGVWSSHELVVITGAMRKLIYAAVHNDIGSTVHTSANSFIDARVNTEKFLDDIVARLKAKQL